MRGLSNALFTRSVSVFSPSDVFFRWSFSTSSVTSRRSFAEIFSNNHIPRISSHEICFFSFLIAERKSFNVWWFPREATRKAANLSFIVSGCNIFPYSPFTHSFACSSVIIVATYALRIESSCAIRWSFSARCSGVTSGRLAPSTGGTISIGSV